MVFPVSRLVVGFPRRFAPICRHTSIRTHRWTSICSVPVGRFSFQWALQPECRSLGFRGPGAGTNPAVTRTRRSSLDLL